MIIKNPLAMKCAFGENPKRCYGQGLKKSPTTRMATAALLRELSAIGNNVNQLAYWANARKSVSEQELQEAIQLTKQAWTLLKDGL